MSPSARRNRFAPLRRGRCPHRPALPSCGTVLGDFACGRVPFAAVQKEPKDHRGRLTGISQCPTPPPPDPFYFTGAAIKNVGNNLPARERTRTRICAPTAAQPLAALPPYGCGVPLAGAAAKGRLNNHLLLQEATRLTSSPRGGLRWTAPPPERARDCQNRAVKRARVPGLHPPARFVACSAGSPLNLSGHRQPRGVHPIGGLRSPLCLVVLRREDFKGEREIEIPLPFDSSLVTFCLYRKLLARRRNILLC